MAGLFDEPSVSFAQVAVERGVDQFPDGFTYGNTERLMPLHVGQLVTVPLGRGNTPTKAWVLEILHEPPTLPNNKEAKQVFDKDSEAIALPPELVDLAKWMSQYYFAPIGPTLATMLPGPVRHGTGLVTRQLVDLAKDPPTDVRVTKKQQQVLDSIASLPQEERPVETSKLIVLANLGSRSPIDRLVDHGLLSRHLITRVEATWFRQSVDQFVPEQLTNEQQTIIKNSVEN